MEIIEQVWSIPGVVIGCCLSDRALASSVLQIFSAVAVNTVAYSFECPAFCKVRQLDDGQLCNTEQGRFAVDGKQKWLE